jgi:hypothetical protein
MTESKPAEGSTAFFKLDSGAKNHRLGLRFPKLEIKTWGAFLKNEKLKIL